ncbi:MAG: long-chain fatty acid--CoA ligase [Bacteroidota bacterium]|nr:long-chain fatty acid--CoA ligase [Candidatus Kapabacteria bacterium]MCS7302645.1 long-chain fatty acid--CoA ligase [Candidatus Kapabacteria bacterium]MCX7936240.1 long-chain fatty acid--CoA ligase [Chlorobiota bacterium]MDW8074479.1 long-chain fatty acid--CoA ligase [Bacteroidota bacterium]
METIPGVFVRITDRYKETDHVAYMYKQQGKYVPVTYRQLREDVEAYAAMLRKIGVEPGDRVGILSENRYEWVLTDFATLLVGGIDVPMFPTLTAKQIAYILNHSQAVCCAVSTLHQLQKVLSVMDDLEYLESIILFDNASEESPEGEGVGSHQHISVYSLHSFLAQGQKIIEGQDKTKMIQDYLSYSRPEEVCTIIYTSGTTGTPKGVMLTHHNILSNVNAALEVIKVHDTDIFLSYLPMCHSYERTTGFYAAFISGATVAFAESLDTVRTNLQEVRPTLMTSVPQLFERVRNGIYARMANQSWYRQRLFEWAITVGLRRVMELEHRGSASISTELQYRLADRLVFSKIRRATGGRLRLFVSGGGPLSADVNRFFWAIGLPILEGYGLTEASPVLTVNRIDDNEFGTVGTPLPGVEVRIDENGEILAKGPNIMRGYWRDPEATAQAIDSEGWLHTGDVGEWTKRGHLKITDRLKNIIVTSGGKNVAPQVVESVILRLPFVSQVVVLGDGRPFCIALIVPHEENLRTLLQQHGVEANRAFQHLCADPKVHEIIQRELEHAQRELAKYERVRRFALLEEPFTVENGLLTPTLKPRRKQISERYAPVIERLYADLMV